jgi:hypothetical protein
LYICRVERSKEIALLLFQTNGIMNILFRWLNAKSNLYFVFYFAVKLMVDLMMLILLCLVQSVFNLGSERVTVSVVILLLELAEQKF